MTRTALVLFTFVLTICLHGSQAKAFISSIPTTENTPVANDDQVTINDYVNEFSDSDDRNDINSGTNIKNYNQDVEFSNHRNKNEDHDVAANTSSNNPQSTTGNDQPTCSYSRKDTNRNVKNEKHADDGYDFKIDIRYAWGVGNQISQTTEESDTNDDHLYDVRSNNCKDFNDSKNHQKPFNEEDHSNDKNKKNSDYSNVPDDNYSESQEVQHPYWEMTDSKNSGEINTKRNKQNNNSDKTGNNLYSNWTVIDEEVSSNNKPQNSNDNYGTKISITQRPYYVNSERQHQREENRNDSKHINENHDPRKTEDNYQWSQGEDMTAEDEHDDKSKKNPDHFDDGSSSGNNGFISQHTYSESLAQRFESDENEQNNNKGMGANNNNNSINTIEIRRPNWEDINRRNHESGESDINTEEYNIHGHKNENSKEVSRRNRNEEDSGENDRSYEDQHPYDNNHREIKYKDYLHIYKYTKSDSHKPCNHCVRYNYNKNEGCKRCHKYDKDKHRHYYPYKKYSYHKQNHGNRENYDDKNSNKYKRRGYHTGRTNSNSKYDDGKYYKYSNYLDGKYDHRSNKKYGDSKYYRNNDYNNKYKKDNGLGHNGNYDSNYHGYNNNHKKNVRDHNDKQDSGHYKKNYYKTKYEDRSWNNNKRHHGGTRYFVEKDGYSSQHNNDKYHHSDKSDSGNYKRDENNNYHRSNNYGKDSGRKDSSYRNRGKYHHYKRD